MTAGPPYPPTQPPSQPPTQPPSQPPTQPPTGEPPGAAGASERQRPAGRPKRKFSTGQFLGGLLFLIVIIFIIENSRTVKIRLLVPEVRAPLYVAILIAAVLGGFITWLLRFRRQRHHR